MYCDLEGILVKLEQTNDGKIRQHVLFSNAYYLKCPYDDELSAYKICTGKDCTSWFVRKLKDIALELDKIFSTIRPMEKVTLEQLN